MHSPVNQSPQNPAHMSSANPSPPRIAEIPPFRPRNRSKEWMPNIEVGRLKVSAYAFQGQLFANCVNFCSFWSFLLLHRLINNPFLSYPLNLREYIAPFRPKYCVAVYAGATIDAKLFTKWCLWIFQNPFDTLDPRICQIIAWTTNYHLFSSNSLLSSYIFFFFLFFI